MGRVQKEGLKQAIHGLQERLHCINAGGHWESIRLDGMMRRH